MSATLPVGDAQAFVTTAHEIGTFLAHTAIWHAGRCNWMGVVPDEASRIGRGMTYSPLGPDLYGGTSGVALFLATLSTMTRDRIVRETSLGAIRQALSRVDALSMAGRLGLFSGVTGIALAAAQIGALLNDEPLVDRAARLVRDCANGTGDAAEFDLISGRAGAITALLALSELVANSALVEFAVRLGDDLLRTANRSDDGYSWSGPSMFQSRDLTGFSHGAAGAGFALLELFAATGETRFREVAERAFAYERRWFDATAGNWPDFRKDPSRPTPQPRATAFATLWCHGAPGIALSRLRAYQITGDEPYRSEAVVALRTTCQMVELGVRSGRGNYSLCHGLAGNAEVLVHGREVLGPVWDAAAALARDVAYGGIERYARRGHHWPCGTGEGETPSLMLGLAGIGYFYLRLADPAIPSILLVRRDAFAARLRGVKETVGRS